MLAKLITLPIPSAMASASSQPPVLRIEARAMNTMKIAKFEDVHVDGGELVGIFAVEPVQIAEQPFGGGANCRGVVRIALLELLGKRLDKRAR